MSLPSDWIQSDGTWYTPVREFTCPDHPWGPPERQVSDAVVECVRFAVGEDMRFADAARVELGICCESHRWIDTGEMRKVSSFEHFMYSNIPPLVELHKTEILKALIADNVLPGERVRIPIIRSGE